MDQNPKRLPQTKQQQPHQLTAIGGTPAVIKLGSSSEELTQEEKYILRSGKRQEPQGEEHSGYSASCDSNINANVASNKTTKVPKAVATAAAKNQVDSSKELPTHHAQQQFAAMMKPSKQTQATNTSATASGGPANSTHPTDSDNRDRTSPSSSESSRDQRESVTPTSSDDEGEGDNHRKQQVQRAERQYRASNNSAERLKSKKGSGSGGSSASHSKSKNMSLDSTHSGHSAYNTLIIHHNNSSLLADTWLPANHEFTSIGMGGKQSSSAANAENNNDASLSPFSNSRSSVSPSMIDSYSQQQSHQAKSSTRPGTHYNQMSPNNLYENIDYQANSGGTSSELSDIPRDYLDQLTVLKHLAKDLQQEPSGGGSNLKRSESFSRSQPDLTQQKQYNVQYPHTTHDIAKSQPQQASGTASFNANWQQTKEGSGGEEVLPSVQILEILMRENSNLKADLLNARRKISTINKLEAELTRLQESHAALFESAERRESLERSARVKLSSELKRLTAVNRELMSSSGSLQNLYTGNLPVDIEAFKKELSNKDLVIAQLVSQNKELVAIKERQEIELNAQRATLAEQRTHIDILDGALTNAQNNVLSLEEECRKKQEYVDKVSQLQRAVSTLQLSNDKREKSEKKIRSQLEGEINDLKTRLTTVNTSAGPAPNATASRGTPTPQPQPQPPRMYQSPPPYPGTFAAQAHQTMINAANQEAADAAQPGNQNAQLQQLREKLKASEEQIYHLNSQVAKWENVFSAPQGQSNVSTPTSWAQSPGGGNGAQNNPFDMEWKIKELEARLNEKDAVIRILQAGSSNISSPVRRSPVQFSPLNSANSSSVPTMPFANVAPPPPSYRDSPGYQQAMGVASGFAPVQGMSRHHAKEASGSLGSGLDRRSPSVTAAAAAASSMYAKMGLIQQQLKSDSEPPNYANISPKLRLGGSGSSLMKTSSESLQHGLGNSSAGSGNSPAGSISGPSSTSGASAAGHPTERKSIDDQLKELDTQLLSKGEPGTLKMHSGLCCIPGFPHPAAHKSQKTISKSLLESLSTPYHLASASCSKYPLSPLSLMGLQIMPPKPPSTYYTQNHGSLGTCQTRTSSGPPFMSSTATAFVPLTPSGGNKTAALSNSVDSVLNDANCSAIRAKPPTGPSGGGGNVFTPIPRGLPPKSPTNVFDSSSGSKSRSLERNKPSSGSGSSDPSAGKYTVFMYDAARCRSLDRNIKGTSSSSKGSGTDGKKSEKESSKGNLKSSVSSKAAFFGQLLTRRSPSPGREKKDKDYEKEAKSSQGVRFPFSGSSKNSSSSHVMSQQSEAEVDAILLDRQGRTSQNSRNRISSKWSSSNTLESVEEQSGSESPWIQRKCNNAGNADRAKSVPSPDHPKQKQEGNVAITSSVNTSTPNIEPAPGLSTSASSSSKKWGRIVKTPFGLRYTFGSPRVPATGADSELNQRK